MSKQTPEGKLKAECRAWLRAQGAYVFSPVQVGMGAATLDDLVCWKGKFVGLEYKRPDTRPPPTKRQEMVMAQIETAEGWAFVVYDLGELQQELWGIQLRGN